MFVFGCLCSWFASERKIKSFFCRFFFFLLLWTLNVNICRKEVFFILITFFRTFFSSSPSSSFRFAAIASMTFFMTRKRKVFFFLFLLCLREVFVVTLMRLRKWNFSGWKADSHRLYLQSALWLTDTHTNTFLFSPYLLD